MKFIFGVAAAFGLAVLAAAADEPGQSGLKRGDQVPPFQVVDVTGSFKGKQLDNVELFGAGPVVLALVNDRPRRSVSLITGIQKLVTARSKDGLRGFVTFVGGPELIEPIENLAQETGIKLSVGVLPLGAMQPEIRPFNLDPNARNTVVVYSRRKVYAVFVNVDEKTLPQVEKAAEEVLQTPGRP
jgi:hypothetical protein